GIICIFLLAYIIHENYISRYYKIAILLIIFFIGFQYDEKKSEELNLSYKLISTDISQDQKFLQENVSVNSDNLIKEIIQAINEKKELVILPETAFAFNLKNTLYEKMLKELSYQIIIITGAFNIQEGKTYNSTYIFKG
ncbi:apolipoprotein N-acyltransferase, partial [Campylobacter coli]|nr:apolipoprotein N-acyltransferase [Campylobacter coli]